MRRYVWLVLAVGLVLIVAGMALAQTGGGYDLSWSVVGSGGGPSEGADYTVDGTIGQSAAGELSGGAYRLAGGFWAGVAEWFRLHLPAVFKNE